MLNIHTTVVILKDALAIKIENAKSIGTEVIVWDRKYDERGKKVRGEVAKHSYTIVHAYADYIVMAGKGTIPWKLWKI